MFPNLRAEMARKGVNVSDLAEQSGIATTTMYDKLSGRTKVTLDEASAIKTALGVDIPIEVLFEKEAL